VAVSGFVLAVVSTRMLHADWLSVPAMVLWVAGLALLVLACVGERAAPAPRLEVTAFPWRLPRAVEGGLLVAMIVVALTMRTWRLGDLGPGMHGDEGEAGTQGLSILNGTLVSPFTPGWFNQTNVYYWSLAVAMKLFGTGLAGLRSFAVLCGVVTVVFVYLLAREMFGQRAAVIAGFFIAFQSAAAFFSRQEFSNDTTPALMTATLYFLVRGLRTRRYLDFVQAGFAAGLSLYYFAGGRLVPLVGAAVLVYLAIFHRGFLRAYWTRAAAFLGALVAISLPWVTYYEFDYPLPSTTYPNDRFVWLHYADLAGQYNVASWPAILWNQLTHTLSVITSAIDVSALDTLDFPIARPLEAALIVLGVAWSLWRWRDNRFALLSLWFWSWIVAGGVLTVDQPNLPRLVGLLPALPVIIAAVLDHFLGLIAAESGRRPAWQPAGPVLGGAVAACAIAICGLQNWQVFVDHYLNLHVSAEVTGQAAYVRAKGPSYRFYDMGVPYIYWGHGVNRFLNPHADGLDLVDPPSALPIVDNGPRGDKNVAFMVWAVMDQYLPLLHAYYPEGATQTIIFNEPRHATAPLICYTVTHQQIDAHRLLHARYFADGGAVVERMEPRLGLSGGTAPPAGLRYPVRAAWDGGLVAPTSATYRLQLTAPAGTHLTIDGRDVFPTGKAGGSATTAVMLAQGPHTIHLAATLPSRLTRIDVQWASGPALFQRIPRRYLWDNHTVPARAAPPMTPAP
jgi:hypothetical protein